MTLLYLALAYMLGIGLGKWILDSGLLGCDLPTWLWWVPFCLLLFTPFLQRWEREREIASPPSLRWPASAGFVPPPTPLSLTISISLPLCLLMGALRMASVPQAGCWTEADLAAWNLPSTAAFERAAPQVTVVGYISNFPTIDDERQEVVVSVNRLREANGEGGEWHAVTGQARLVTAARPRYFYGQPVEVTGRLATPPDFEDFSYREFLARQGIHSHFYGAKVVVGDGPMQGAAWRRWLCDVRSRAMTLVERMLPEPHAGLAEGILLGVDAGIADALYDRFNATGTSHVLVISGRNVFA